MRSKLPFIFYTALTYFKGRRKSKGLASSLISLVGIAFGVMVLITVIAVMNGLQNNYIGNLLEISSYHLQIIPRQDEVLSRGQLEELSHHPLLKAIVPFKEYQVLIDRVGEWSETSYGILRALDVKAALKDEDFIRHLFGHKYQETDLQQMTEDFLIGTSQGVLAGYLFSQYLGLKENSEIVISTIDDLSWSLMAFHEETSSTSSVYPIKGIFKSGYKDIDNNYLFISLATPTDLADAQGEVKSAPLLYGIKLKDRFKDLIFKDYLEHVLDQNSFEIKTWRDYNRAYFSALYTEKASMFFLISLMFVVVAFNIYYSLHRLVVEKTEEIAVLKAMGATPVAVKAIFILEGLFIGIGGGLFGVICGLFLATHINECFEVLAWFVNYFLRFLELCLSGLAINVDLGTFESPFSPRVFYFKEVPVTIIPEEVGLIFCFAWGACCMAAYLASRRISEIKPAEVLRNE